MFEKFDRAGILQLGIALWIGGVMAFSHASAADRFDASVVPEPLRNARVGQWVIYRIGGKALKRSSIVAADESKGFLIRSEQGSPGAYKTIREDWVAVNDNYKDLKMKMFDNMTDMTVEYSSAIISGKEIPVTLVSGIKLGDRWVITLSDRVPIYGEVKHETEAYPVPIVELIDFEF